MKKTSILVADSDPQQRRLTTSILREFSDFNIVGECSNSLEAVRNINALEPGLLLLDIDLHGKNGWYVLEKIIHMPAVIFTTKSRTHAVKAFEHNAVDYLLKPFTKDRLHSALVKYLTCFHSKMEDTTLLSPVSRATLRSRIFVEIGRKIESISLQNVTYFKADRDYTWIYTQNNGAFLSSCGISTIERKLDRSRFIRVHRSYIINIEHIQSLYKDISRLFVTLPNDVEINVSRNYLPTIRQLIL